MSFLRSTMRKKPSRPSPRYRRCAGSRRPSSRWRFLGTVVVALHHLRSAHAEFARLPVRHRRACVIADLDLGRRHRQADRTVVRGQRQRIDGRRRRGFGESVGFDQRVCRSPFSICRQRPSAPPCRRRGHLQRREIQVAELGVVEQCIEQRIDHAGQHGELVLGHSCGKARNVARVGDQHVLAPIWKKVKQFAVSAKM